MADVMELTPEKLAEIRAKMDAATQGEWRCSPEYEKHDWCVETTVNHEKWTEFVVIAFIPEEKANAEFIAATDPPTIRAMLDALAEKDAEIERLRKFEPPRCWCGKHKYDAEAEHVVDFFCVDHRVREGYDS